MTTMPPIHTSLTDAGARGLAIATRTAPQMTCITPRWLPQLLHWVPLESGIYRVNRVKDESNVVVDCSERDERVLPGTFVNYVENPREYLLSAVTTVVEVHTRISDLYGNPYDQIAEQLRLTVEIIKERQESELINNAEYGLLSSAVPSQRIKSRTGRPTPDDMDDLIARVWKEPGFFLAHPLAIAAFGRECTRRGVPPPTVTLFGSQFMTWRGLPLIPCDKIAVEAGKTSILLIRTGESRQGVVGLFQSNLPGGDGSPGLAVRFMGVNQKAIASYLVSLYCSLAVLAEDALAVLEGVDVGMYHDYN